MDYKERPTDPLFKDCLSTPLTEEEVAFYLRQAWKEIYKAEATREQLCILWCHTSLETGRGKFIYNNNFGNIKRKLGVTYTSYKCNEILNGKAQWFEPYHPQTFFQHWDSPTEGAKSYLQFLNKTKYQPALEALKEGSIPKYCAKLKSGGYFTADLNYYTSLMTKLSKSFERKSEGFMKFIPENYVAPSNEEEKKSPDSAPATIREPFAQDEKKEHITLPSSPEPEPSAKGTARISMHPTREIEIYPIEVKNEKISFFEKIFKLILDLITKIMQK